MPQLEEAYVTTYNSLTRDYCDPFARTLESATIVTFGEVNSLGNIPVEIRLEGSCSQCEGLDIGVYDIPTSLAEAQRKPMSLLEMDEANRALQELCFCPSNGVGDRAPFEAEFVTAYQTSISELNLGCITTVGDCFFGTNFGTGVLVEFEGAVETLTADVLESIASAFLDSANAEFENDDLECNPQFRVVESVDATIVSAKTRRKLTGTQARKLQDAIPSTDSPSGAPTVSNAPSVSAAPSISSAPSLPEITIGTPSVDVFLFVTGVCNKCENDLLASNQVVGRRQLSLTERFLEDVAQETAVSNCFCQIGAVIEDKPPPPEELEDTFRGRLRETGVEVEVKDLEEVAVAECDLQINDFETKFEYRVVLPSSTRREEVTTISNFIVESYNLVAEDFCDPQEKRLEDLLLAEFRSRDAEPGCTEFTVTFDVFGTCRECDNGTPLFDRESPDRRLSVLEKHRLQAFRSMMPNRRFLQVDDECICEGLTIDDRAPFRSEFDEVFFELLEQVGIPTTCEPSLRIHQRMVLAAPMIRSKMALVAPTTRLKTVLVVQMMALVAPTTRSKTALVVQMMALAAPMIRSKTVLVVQIMALAAPTTRSKTALVVQMMALAAPMTRSKTALVVQMMALAAPMIRSKTVLVVQMMDLVAPTTRSKTALVVQMMALAAPMIRSKTVLVVQMMDLMIRSKTVQAVQMAARTIHSSMSRPVLRMNHQVLKMNHRVLRTIHSSMSRRVLRVNH